jgi:hypothetical protein
MHLPSNLCGVFHASVALVSIYDDSVVDNTTSKSWGVIHMTDHKSHTKSAHPKYNTHFLAQSMEEVLDLDLSCTYNSKY